MCARYPDRALNNPRPPLRTQCLAGQPRTPRPSRTIACSLGVTDLIRSLFLGATCAATLAPTIAAAQEGLPAHIWSRGTTLSASVGAASASPGTGALAGVGVGWEVTPRFGIEGAAAWLDRPGDSAAFAAALTAHFRLRGLQTISPYLKGGIGMYRLSLAAPRATFTDPSVVVGGGIRLFATKHLAFRPEVER